MMVSLIDLNLAVKMNHEASGIAGPGGRHYHTSDCQQS